MITCSSLPSLSEYVLSDVQAPSLFSYQITCSSLPSDLYQYLCCVSLAPSCIIVFLSWLLITPWPLLSPLTCVGASQCSSPWPLFCLSVLNFNPVWVSIKSSAGSCRLWKLFSASKQCVAKVLFQTQWKQYSTSNMEGCSHAINGIQGRKLWSWCDLG